jgi:hypothetical protein
MKRCAQCHGKLGLGVRSRNLWNRWWWVHVRFCSSRCEALYELEQTTPMHVRGPSSLASILRGCLADTEPRPECRAFPLQVARRATGRPSGEVRHCPAAGRARRLGSPECRAFSLQVARRATGRPSGEVRHCRAAGRARRLGVTI